MQIIAPCDACLGLDNPISAESRNLGKSGRKGPATDDAGRKDVSREIKERNSAEGARLGAFAMRFFLRA